MIRKSLLKIVCSSILLILISSCHDDPCDVRHTVVDGECIPDYIFPEKENLKSGDTFYHNTYGVIVFKEGNWFTDKGKLISEMNIKKN
ncbi:hypothetical protein [Psychroserpens mesophilus]|uniref:hypothetical protein n=1 Tax=Psychroserpens mesophilus TaxID=325473 RepID=UPI003D65CE59